MQEVVVLSLFERSVVEVVEDIMISGKKCFSGLLGFVYGWWVQRFLYTFYACAVGGVVSVFLTLPWPYFNQDPVKWRKCKEVKED